MGQDSVNSGFSGDISTVQSQITDLYQQLLLRPTIDTYSSLVDTFNQQLGTVGTNNTTLDTKYLTLENAFTALKLLHNQRHALFTGHTGARARPGHVTLFSKVVISTGNYSLAKTDDFVLFSGAGGALTGTLPNVTGLSGHVLFLKKIDTGAGQIVITGSSAGQLIDGSGIKSLTGLNDSAMVVTNGANWFLF